MITMRDMVVYFLPDKNYKACGQTGKTSLPSAFVSPESVCWIVLIIFAGTPPARGKNWHEA
jgi:hypothetical protein